MTISTRFMDISRCNICDQARRAEREGEIGANKVTIVDPQIRELHRGTQSK